MYKAKSVVQKKKKKKKSEGVWIFYAAKICVYTLMWTV